jgi:polyhydroxyalkanoate synthesis regulator phasin
MLEGIQKVLLAGVGATVVTLDIVETGLKYLVNRGRITADEAKEAARKIMEEGRKEAEASGTELGTRFARALNKANLVTQDQYRALEERVSALEQRVYVPQTPQSPE